MNEVVTKYTIPAELLGFFEHPPVLINESSEDYDQVLTSTIKTIEPKNTFEWLLVKDLVDLTWEDRRLGKVKADIVNSTWKEAVRTILESFLPGDLEERHSVARELSEAYFGTEGRDRVLTILARHKLTEDAIAAHSLTLRLPELELIDRQLQRVRLARIAIARDLLYHRIAGSWKGPADVLAIVDATASSIPLSPSSDPAALSQ
jgi:hypothetical protein